MHALAVEHHRVVQRLLDPLGKLALAVRQAGDAAFAGRPVARRQVEQHLLDIGRLQPLGDIVGRPVVREQVFDPLKPGRRRPREAVVKRRVGEQKTEVGSELWHGGNSL
jgi:hypothetical protein